MLFLRGCIFLCTASGAGRDGCIRVRIFEVVGVEVEVAYGVFVFKLWTSTFVRFFVY